MCNIITTAVQGRDRKQPDLRLRDEEDIREGEAVPRGHRHLYRPHPDGFNGAATEALYHQGGDRVEGLKVTPLRGDMTVHARVKYKGDRIGPREWGALGRVSDGADRVRDSRGVRRVGLPVNRHMGRAIKSHVGLEFELVLCWQTVRGRHSTGEHKVYRRSEGRGISVIIRKVPREHGI
jgi:hypothetical protein